VLAKQQFYYKESWIHDNDEIVKKIPKDAYLVTVNNLSPQVAYRKNIFYYPQNIRKAEYIFVDLHPNQPITNFWLTRPNYEAFKKDIDKLLAKKAYVIVYKSNDALLLQRNTKIPFPSLK
jgi:hypothetical protein